MPPPAFVPVITVELFPGNGGPIIVSTLDQQFDVTWQDLHNDTGTGEFKLPVGHADAADVIEGAFVRCYVDGVHRYTWVVEDADKVFVTRDEEVAEVIHARGRGLLVATARYVVYPAGGVDAEPVTDDRLFNFASRDFTPVGWSAPTDLGAQSSGPAPWTDTGSPAPLTWPDPAARWIWGDNASTSLDRVYFHTTFTVPSTKRVVILCTADDKFTVYLNGVPTLAEVLNISPWRAIYKREIELPAGTYTLGAVVENTVGSGGFLCSVFTLNAAGALDVLLRRSDITNWQQVTDPATAPGFTPGGILAAVIEEAIDRGSALSYDFDADDDSNGDAWPTIPDFAVPVGSTLLDLVLTLAEQGYVDVTIDYVTQELHAFNPEGAMTVTAVTYSAGVNIAELSHKQAEPIVNRLLVKWPRGFIELFDNGSISTHGVYEGYYTVDSDDVGQVIELGGRQLDRLKDGDPAIVVAIEHEPDTNADPYVDFDLGDKVNAPNAAGVSTSYRVLGITVVQDEHGDPNWTLELNRRGSTRISRLTDLLQAVTGGSVGGFGTPVNIVPVGGTGIPPSGGSTDPLPGDYDGTCADPEEDALASEDPYSDSDIYIPLVCSTDSVREQRSDETLGWGAGFESITNDGGDHLITMSDGYSGVTTAVLGDLTILDLFSEPDVTVALTLSLKLPPGAAAAWVEIMTFGGGVNVYARDDGSTYSVRVECATPDGAVITEATGLGYENLMSTNRQLIMATYQLGGDMVLYVNRHERDRVSANASNVETTDPLFVSYLPARSTVGRIALWQRLLDNDELGAIPQIRTPDPLRWDYTAAKSGGGSPVCQFTSVIPGDVVICISAARDTSLNIGSGMNQPQTSASTCSFGTWTALTGGAATSFDSQGVGLGQARVWWAPITGAGTAELSTTHPGQVILAVLIRGADDTNPIRDEHVSSYSLNPGIALVGSAMDNTEIGFMASSGVVGSNPPVFNSTNGMAVQMTNGPVDLLQSGRTLAAFGLAAPGFGFRAGITGTLDAADYDDANGGWVAYCIGINWLDPDL